MHGIGPFSRTDLHRSPGITLCRVLLGTVLVSVTLTSASNLSGSSIHPAALSALLRTAKPGEVLVIAPGVYRDLVLSLGAQGQPDRPIIIRPESPGSVVFTGSSSVELRGVGVTLNGLRFEECTASPLLLRDTRSCRVMNCSFIRCNPPDNRRTHWLRVVGGAAADNRVDHCRFEGKTADGVMLVVDGSDGKMPTQTRIDSNHFALVVRAVRNGMETIRLGTSSYGQSDAFSVVEGNLFERCSGDAEIISVKSSGNIIRRNTFRGCEGGVVLRHGYRSRVESNYFFGDGVARSAGIRVHGSDHRVFNNYLQGLGGYSLALPNGQSRFQPAGHEPTISAVVAHNTIVGSLGPSIEIGGEASELRDLRPTNCTVANNLWIGPKSVLLRGSADGVRLTGNLASDVVPARRQPAFAEVLAPLEVDEDAVRRPGNGVGVLLSGYRLGEIGPADDLCGTLRSLTEVPHVGAELVGCRRHRRPLKPADVGPRSAPVD